MNRFVLTLFLLICSQFAAAQSIKDIDNNSYDTVRIGTQTWFTRNLAVTRLNDGTPIANVTSQSAWAASKNASYCWYNNDAANGAIYGALYNGYVVKTDKLCPAGWHVPSHAEWSTLVSTLGGPAGAGGKLKATGTAHWQSPNVGATNEVGFSALPGGYRPSDNFYVLGVFGNWWSSTEYEPDYAWTQSVKNNEKDILSPSGRDFGSGLSIRCIKDFTGTCRTKDGVETINSCGPYTWIDGITYNLNTTAPTHRLTTKAGCDSLIRLHLIVHNSTFSIQTITACDAFTWIDGNSYTTSTAAPMLNLMTKAGCDSLVRLNLTIIKSTTSTHTVSACDSYNWIDGKTYISSTSEPLFKLKNKAGCDSLVRLNLSIRKSTTSMHTVSSCDSYNWIDGKTYISSTSEPIFKTKNKAGCDSLVRLNLSIRKSTTFTHTVSSCDSYSWIDGKTYTSSTNSPKFKLINKAGCDSLVSLNLTIKKAQVSISHLGSVMTSDIVAESYAWYDCNSNKYVENANQKTFEPSVSGSYRLEVRIDGCKWLSSCLVAVVADLRNKEANTLKLYPNPFTDVVCIESEPNVEKIINIYDTRGIAVAAFKSSLDQSQVDLRQLGAGIYVVKIQSGKGTEIIRLLKVRE